MLDRLLNIFPGQVGHGIWSRKAKFAATLHLCMAATFLLQKLRILPTKRSAADADHAPAAAVYCISISGGEDGALQRGPAKLL